MISCFHFSPVSANMYIHVAYKWAGITKTIEFGEKMRSGKWAEVRDMKSRYQNDQQNPPAVFGSGWGPLALILSTSLLIISGCASTDIKSAVDMKNQKPYMKILLFVPIKNLLLRDRIEKAIMQEFKIGIADTVSSTFGKGITEYHWILDDNTTGFHQVLFNCSDLAPLWDEMTPFELDDLLSQNDFEATMVVSPEAYWTTSAYIPQQTNTNFIVTPFSASAATKTIGGYTVEIEHWQIDTRIYDFKTGKIVWKATSVSSNSILGGNLVKSYAKDLIQQIRKDRIVPSKIRKVKS